MQTKQPTLLNYSQFDNMNLYNSNVIISKAGIVHSNRATCSICGEICSYNGSSNKGRHALSRGSQSFFKKGQQHCPNCNHTIQIENSWLNNIISLGNEFIASQVLSLSKGFSEDEIMKHLSDTMSIEISKGTVHNIISKSNEDLKDLEFEYQIHDGFYGYDEQYLKINGKRAYRIVFFDLTKNTIIYEKIHYQFSKKILSSILKEVFGDNVPKGFVVDMRIEYPDSFRSVFGRKIKIQFCIFHLNKLILKEYSDSLKIGKTTKWTLPHYFNLYSLFNIFYNRCFELKMIKVFIKEFEHFKEVLTSEKIEFYSQKYKLKVKTFEKKKQKVIEIIERKIMKAFRRILHDKKNQRKRQKANLKKRTVEDSRRVFEKIMVEKNYFPQKITKRIERIKKNFEYFIASDTEVLTNNRLEGFFGATLKKFRKKINRSIVSVSSMLKRKRLEQSGTSFFRKFTFHDLSKLFMIVEFFS